MNKLKKIINSSIIRWFFLAVALAGLLWVIIKNWGSLTKALATLPWQIAVASFVLAVVYVFFTMWSWRVILADLGSTLNWNTSIQLFGLSQIGKYIPGGVWNIVAAAEIGRDHEIPARRSVTAMTVAVLISLLSGAGIGVITVLSTSVSIQVPTWLIVLLLAILVALLMPPVLNRLIGLGFKLLKRPAPERQITFKGLGLATLLAVIAWIIAGVQIWLLACGFGMQPSAYGMALSIGAYALAWIVGFLVVFVPAGTGVREGVLGLFFTSTLTSGGVLAVVLVSRIAMTFADLLFAAVGILLRMKKSRSMTVRHL
ncbi:lysylphosphatidylglycerol synthase transmembrane domain-containing protein [Bifidobacterium adolescentis]|uniref:Lysylphosphatidylglycerol synthase transmembrane domain-containing protein n=1 Tax=Bifidobacterium adolescentis TaxID=1680 RepID=A0ABN6ZJ24_BIFAD|nr:lysylphosphatidylglycerol synthase transmembrane domain-containing protein [Bifidobacterium faecale]